jgi:hypothetical protein
LLQVWGYATLGHPLGHTVANAIAEAAIWRMQDFTAQHVANTLWAFAKLEFRHERLLRASAQRAQHILHEFRPQTIANMVGPFPCALTCLC